LGALGNHSAYRGDWCRLVWLSIKKQGSFWIQDYVSSYFNEQGVIGSSVKKFQPWPGVSDAAEPLGLVTELKGFGHGRPSDMLPCGGFGTESGHQTSFRPIPRKPGGEPESTYCFSLAVSQFEKSRLRHPEP